MCPKPSNMHMAHSKADVTHILVVVLLNLVRSAVYESQDGCCGDISIPIPQIQEKQVNLCECNVETFHFHSYITCGVIMYTNPMRTVILKKGCTSLSLPEQLEDMW